MKTTKDLAMAETTKKKQNLYEKLLLITEEIGKIDKTGRNTQQGYGFIEAAQVSAEVRVQLVKHGVMIMPETISRKIERYTTMKPGYKESDPPKESSTYHVNVVSRYTLINADDPADRIVLEWDGGEALDMSDKATNKAITASNKYFLMKLFNISDKEDPDAHTIEVEQDVHPAEPSRDINEDIKDNPKRMPTVEELRDLKKTFERKGIHDNAKMTAFVNETIGKKAITTLTELEDMTMALELMKDEEPF